MIFGDDWRHEIFGWSLYCGQEFISSCDQRLVYQVSLQEISCDFCYTEYEIWLSGRSYLIHIPHAITLSQRRYGLSTYSVLLNSTVYTLRAL